MAKIIFLQNMWFKFLGPMYISAALKRAGHDCELLIGQDADDFLPLLHQQKPDLIAFSVMTGLHSWVGETAARLKKELDCRIILGGPHPTFFPEVIEHGGIDIICRGEGEEAMVELADALDSAREITPIANLWVKTTDNRIVRNDVRPLVENLDALPDPDRELYCRYPALQDDPVQVFISSRGCPYDCSFCFNHQMAALYRGKGRYVRHRSPDTVLEEIAKVTATNNAKRIYFADDTFALNQKWLRDFLPSYGRRFRIPFHCLVRIDQIDDGMARLLYENGCEAVFFGIESGDEGIRNGILNKQISDEDIRRGAAILKKNGIKFRTYNIIGFPGETFSQALQTVYLNIAIGTDFPWCSLFMPYPGTRLAEYACAKGYLSADTSVDQMATSFHITSVLTNPDRNRLINLHKFFQTAVVFPPSLHLIKPLTKIPTNSLFQLWFGFVYFLLFIRSEGRGWRWAITSVLRNWRFFKK
jgi:radical SAM superfamily enzyme YgiQ (UPF0313 family)